MFSVTTLINIIQISKIGKDRNNVSILFSTGSVEEPINTSTDVSENTMEYFF